MALHRFSEEFKCRNFANRSTMASSEPPPGGSGSSGPPFGKGEGESSSSGASARGESRDSRALIDIFGGDVVPAAVVLVLLLLNLLRGELQHTALCLRVMIIMLERTKSTLCTSIVFFLCWWLFSDYPWYYSFYGALRLLRSAASAENRASIGSGGMCHAATWSKGMDPSSAAGAGD